MCPVAVEGRYLLNRKPEEAFSLVQQVLTEMGLKEWKVKKSVPSSFLLVEYKAGWLEKKEIQFTFQKRQSATEVSIKWFYGSDFTESMVDDKKLVDLIRTSEKSIKEQTQRLLEELRCRIGANDIPLVEEEKRAYEKEVIREKEVIVKIRCSYCHAVFDETLNECPHCGARR